jgi:hypothetical protein
MWYKENGSPVESISNEAAVTFESRPTHGEVEEQAKLLSLGRW